MRIHNLVKNIFLLAFIFSFFLNAGVINAAIDVEGDTEGLLNSNSKGSWYIGDATNGLGETRDSIASFYDKWLPIGGLASKVTEIEKNLLGVGVDDKYYTLHSAVATNPKLTKEEFNALKEKLKEDGSPIANKITIDNVSRQNTSKVSVFVYDPTEKNANNGDSVNIGYATSKEAGGLFYTAMKPSLAESTQANKELNIIDANLGLTAGTTAAEKSFLYNKNLENKLLQEKVSDLEQEKIKADQDLIKAQQSGDQQAIQAAIEKANEAARKLEDAKKNLGQNEEEIKQREELARQQEISERNARTTVTECSTVGSFFTLNCMLKPAAYLTNLIFNTAAFMTGIAGTLFDYSLEFSINSAELIKKIGVVEVTWSFVRDILNMTFIFILLWTAIQILIGRDEKNYNARKVLTRVVIVAIGINFSLFAAKLMVDGSNIISLKIYEAMKANSATAGSSISSRIMNSLDLTAFYNTKQIYADGTVGVSGACINSSSKVIIISILGTVMLMVVTLAMGLAAVLFLIRMVNIIILFIKSPIWIWSFVLPGNPKIKEFGDKWWAEMKGVLTFPIMYLLWMLVGLIVFEKLGSVRDGSGNRGILTLICNEGIAAGSVNESISLIAIFCIVIIFMMKAVEYGIKHSGDAGGWGADISKKTADRFGGWQTAVTKGLRDKAAGYTKSAAIGGGKRTAGLLSGVVSVGAKGDTLKERMAQGFLNPGTYTKERLANITGRAAVLTGSKTLAEKSVSLAESAEKSRKEIYKERTKSATEKEEAIQKVAAQQYKIDTQEQWEKKNGVIGSDAGQVAKYEEYIKNQIEKQADVKLGKGIIKQKNKDKIEHLEEIRKKAISKEEIKDASGNITGYKIKVSNHSVASGFGDVFKYHTTGKGAEEQKIDKRGLWKPFRTKKAEARIKSAEKLLAEEVSKYSTEKAEKDLSEIIKKTEQKLSNMPDDKTLDDLLTSGSIIPPTSPAVHYAEIKKLNKMLIKQINLKARIRSARSGATITPLKNELDELEDKISDHIENIKKTRNSDSEKLVKKKEELKKKEEQKNK